MKHYFGEPEDCFFTEEHFFSCSPKSACEWKCSPQPSQIKCVCPLGACSCLLLIGMVFLLLKKSELNFRPELSSATFVVPVAIRLVYAVVTRVIFGIREIGLP